MRQTGPDPWQWLCMLPIMIKGRPPESGRCQRANARAGLQRQSTLHHMHGDKRVRRRLRRLCAKKKDRPIADHTAFVLRVPWMTYDLPRLPVQHPPLGAGPCSSLETKCTSHYVHLCLPALHVKDLQGFQSILTPCTLSRVLWSLTPETIGWGRQCRINIGLGASAVWRLPQGSSGCVDGSKRTRLHKGAGNQKSCSPVTRWTAVCAALTSRGLRWRRTPLCCAPWRRRRWTGCAFAPLMSSCDTHNAIVRGAHPAMSLQVVLFFGCSKRSA
jgi:hypothetical protein